MGASFQSPPRLALPDALVATATVGGSRSLVLGLDPEPILAVVVVVVDVPVAFVLHEDRVVRIDVHSGNLQIAF